MIITIATLISNFMIFATGVLLLALSLLIFVLCLVIIKDFWNFSNKSIANRNQHPYSRVKENE